MTLRRLVDYTGIGVWVASVIFGGGILYAEQRSHKAYILDNKQNAIALEQQASMHKQQIELIKIEVKSIQVQQAFQKEWQSEFMTTFKEMVTEIKATNESVLKNSYHLRSIEEKVEGVILQPIMHKDF